jgi:hypothetical protein
LEGRERNKFQVLLPKWFHSGARKQVFGRLVSATETGVDITARGSEGIRNREEANSV